MNRQFVSTFDPVILFSYDAKKVDCKSDMPSTDECPLCVKSPLEESNKITQVLWLQCSPCQQWYHIQCLALPATEVNSIHDYHCTRCERKHGPLTLKRRLKRAKIMVDYVALNDGNTFIVDKSEHPHVNRMLRVVQDMASDDKKDSDSEKYNINSHNYIITSNPSTETLDTPTLIPNCDLESVGMRMPRARELIDVDYITECVGEDETVEVMDVLSQQGVQPAWKMGQWRDYFKLDNRDRIRNVISLEVSESEVGQKFTRPRVVRELDLVDHVWRRDDPQPRSKVTKYCLMSVCGSFTDFHIDFGGTSVYYTVCSGAKTFLMYPPTAHNLEVYERWCLDQDQNYLWLPDYDKGLKDGISVTLKPGDLFLIPSGWIHAVYTPKDSIVIGGNFLTVKDMAMQITISNIEKRTGVPLRFRFPMFNKVLWLTGYEMWRRKDDQKASESIIADKKTTNGVKTEDEVLSEDGLSDFLLSRSSMDAFVDHLSAHYELSKNNTTAKRSIPFHLIGKDVYGFLEQLKGT